MTKVKDISTVADTDPLTELTEELRAEIRVQIRKEIERRIQLELAQTERALAELQREIQVLLDDTEADLARLMRKNAQRAQLEAYYKGLTFQLGAKDAKRTGDDSSH
jgi:hypothetical protein